MSALLSRIVAYRSVLRRLGWGVLDQAMSSLQNFLLGVFVARALGAVSLGALSIAFLVYATVLSGYRGLATDPLAVRFSGRPDHRWAQGAAAATGTALVLGAVAGVGCVAGGAAVWLFGSHAEVAAALVALGVTLPGLTLQDSWRGAFFTSGQGSKAFANDTAWTVMTVAGLAALAALDHDNVAWSLLAFGGTAYIAAGLGCIQAGLLPRPQRVAAWLRTHFDLGGRFLVENTILGVSGQARPAIVSTSGGLPAAGAVRGAEMLMGPVVMLLMGIAQVAVPETVRSVARGRRTFRRLCMLISVVLAAAAGAWGILMLVVLPRGLGEFLLGDVWRVTADCFPAIAVSATFGCLQVGPSAGMRALGRADRTLRCQFIVVAIFLTLTISGAILGGVQTVLWCAAASVALAAVIWWTELLRCERAHFGSDRDSLAAQVARAVPEVEGDALIETVVRDG